MISKVIIECLDCGHQTNFEITNQTCPHCNSSWREARYDYESISKNLLTDLPHRPFDLWRYRELLPILEPSPELMLGEGGTPLLLAANLGKMLGMPNILIKDERQGPTSSFKDRQAAVAVQAFKELGVNEIVLASTGNVAISFSAYSARAVIKLWAFLTSLVPASKMREVALYGSQVVKVTGSYDQTKKIAGEFARQRHLYYDNGSRSIPSIESMKTIAFEVCEQMTQQQGPPSNYPWRAPDWYFQSVSGGLGPLGVIKGFEELKQMGWIEKVPKFGIIQVEGCSPMVHAWKQGKDIAQPILMPHTLIATLATGDPGRTYTLLRQKILRNNGGAFESVTDEEAFRAMHYLAKMEGLSVEPASAVAFAGLVKLVRSGQVQQSETVVINCTGHTMPIERNILGDGWSKNVISPQAMEENVDEGLLAALSQVSIDRFPRILIADDNPEVRQLLRRILHTQGKYTLFEAVNGEEAIQMARKERPNLILLDLMMPEKDGFTVLDTLRQSPETADIPVVVITAQELTPAEKARLQGHIQTLMQKGDFLSDELLDEVRALLG
jgi:threonine synthase